MFFWNSLAFSMIQRMLAIWSLIPLPFLKPHGTQARQRGATPHPRSGAEAGRIPCPRGSSQEELPQRLRSGAVAKGARLQWHSNSREELPHVRSQGQRLGGANPCQRPRAAAGRSYPMTEVRGGGPEEQPHVQGAEAVQLEELPHVQGQEGRWWGDTPCPR